jgi:cellulose synthase operon protein C
MASPAKSLNTKLLVACIGVVFSLLLVIFVVHRIQVRRNASGLANLARIKRDEGQTNESIGLFARYLQYRPNDAQAHAEFARLLIERAELPTASRAQRQMAYDGVDAAVRKNPDDLLLRKRLAQFMLRFGRYGDAGREIDIIRERLATGEDGEASYWVDDDELSLMRAQAYAGSGKYPEAAEAAASVLGFDLTNKSFDGLKEPGEFTLGASIVLSDVLAQRLEDPETAERVLQQAVVSCAEDHRSWITLATWQRTRGQVAEAAESVKTASRLAPDDKDVLFTAIDVALQQERFTDAERLSERLREMFPEDERVYRATATAAARQGNAEQAIEVLRGALRKRSDLQIDPALMLLLLGDLYLQQQSFNKVEDVIGEFVSLYGTTNPAIAMLEARLLIARQKWLPATRKLEEIRPLVASSEETTKQVDILLGQCHERLGQYDEQLAANRRVLSEEYDSIIARVGAADALLGGGKPDEALAELETVAAGMTAERLLSLPQVWKPLLRLRVDTMARRRPEDRDWSLVDGLLDDLEQSPLVSTAELNLLKADASGRRGDFAGATATLQREVERNPGHAQAWAGLAMLSLRSAGVDAARNVLAAVPADVAEDPLLVLVQAQFAMQASPEERDTAFAHVESRAADLPDAEAARLLNSLAMMQRAVGNARETERLFMASQQRSPDDLKSRTVLFELACEEGDVEKAMTSAAEIGRVAGETSPTGRVSAAAARILGVRVRRAERVRQLQAADASLELDDTERQLLSEANAQLILAENERPGWAQIQQLFAEVASLRGDSVEAIDRLQRAVAMGLTSPAVIRQLVALLYMSNRLAEAQQTLASLGAEGTLSGLERLSAELEMTAGQFAGAVAIAERSLDEDKQLTVGDMLWFGQVLTRAGKTERAAEVFERARAQDPKRSEPWLALFANQLVSGQRQLAEQTLREAVEALVPPARQLVEAQCDELIGRYDEAEEGFRAAIAAAPGNVVVSRSLASYLIRRGRLAAARTELEAMAAATGEDSGTKSARMWARRALASIIAEPGGYRDVEQAVALLEENLNTEGRPAAEDLTQLIGMLASRPEPSNWRRALDALAKLAAIQPLSTSQRLERIQLLDRTGDWEECRSELLTLVSDPAATTEYSELLVGKLIQRGELDAAASWLERIERRLPEAPATLALQARLALARNDRPTAIAAARKLMPGSLPADSLNAQIGSVAQLMEELGFKKVADSLFEKWAELSPPGLLARAEFLGREHRADEALDLLEQYRDRIAAQRILQASLAVLHAQGGSVSEAQFDRVDRWLTKAIREDPDAVGLSLLLADMRSLAGRDADVLVIYRDLFRRDDLTPTQRAIVANNLAFHLARPETVSEAKVFVELALAELGPHPDVLDTRGMVLLAAGESGAAVDALSEAVLDRSATKYLHLACALAADQRMEHAKRALAEARKRGLDTSRLAAHDVELLRSLESQVGGS